MENVDWETFQTKYVLDLFRAQYQKKTLSKLVVFLYENEEMNKTILTNKLKAVRIKFRAAVGIVRKSGHGRAVLLCFDKCEQQHYQQVLRRIKSKKTYC